MRCKRCDYTEVKYADQLCDGCRTVSQRIKREVSYEAATHSDYVNPHVLQSKDLMFPPTAEMRNRSAAVVRALSERKWREYGYKTVT